MLAPSCGFNLLLTALQIHHADSEAAKAGYLFKNERTDLFVFSKHNASTHSTGACHSVLQTQHVRRANMLARTMEMESLVIIVGRKRLVTTINGVSMCCNIVATKHLHPVMTVKK